MFKKNSSSSSSHRISWVESPPTPTQALPSGKGRQILTPSQSHTSAASKQGPWEGPAAPVMPAPGEFMTTTEGRVLPEHRGQRE